MMLSVTLFIFEKRNPGNIHFDDINHHITFLFNDLALLI